MVNAIETTERENTTRSVEDWLEGHARSVKSAKISHAMITPGLTIEQALAKATLTGYKQLNGLIFWLEKLEQREIGLNAPPPLNRIAVAIMRLLIGSSSINGKARFEAIEADSNIIDQAAHQTFITGKPSQAFLKTKKGMGFLRRNNGDKENDFSE